MTVLTFENCNRVARFAEEIDERLEVCEQALEGEKRCRDVLREWVGIGRDLEGKGREDEERRLRRSLLGVSNERLMPGGRGDESV